MEKSSDILAGGCRAGNSDGGAENRSLLQTRKMLIGQILNIAMASKNYKTKRKWMVYMKKAHCMFMCCVDCFLVYSVKSGGDSFYRFGLNLFGRNKKCLM